MTRAEIRLGVTGAFPRPEELVKATRDLDRGRIPPEAAEAAFQDAEARVAQVEERLGLDVRTGGHLRWADPFRPFTELWSGARAGTLTRFFETNTFYRQPTFAQPPGTGKGTLAPWLPRSSPARAILPGPYTFARLSEFGYALNAGPSPVVAIADAMAASLREAGARRPAQVEFLEPMLTYDPPKGEAAEVVGAYQRLAAALPDAQRWVWTYFGDAGPVWPLLARLPVHGVGFDLFESHLPAGARLPGSAVGFGCLESRTTLSEDAPGVLALARHAIDTLRPSTVWLGPSPPLDLLPFDAAVAKLESLPRLREALTR